MMKVRRSVILFLLMSCPVLTAACATQSTGADDKASVSSQQRAEADDKAAALTDSVSGVQKDSLDACVKRIPSDATGGQRMLAEQSCQRDESIRKKYPHRESLQ